MAFRDFRDFSAWQKGFNLLLTVYKVTKEFPPDELYGMRSDIRRAANSVIHNIAEGFGRYERKDKTRFYKISRGSAYELISHCMAAQALGYMQDVKKEQLIDGYKEIIQEISKVIRAVESR